MSTAICTIVTRNRLHLARVLMHSVASACPDVERHVLFVDEPTPYFDPKNEPFVTTVADSNVLPRFHDFAFVNDVLGLACMLKPAFAKYLLVKHQCDRVIYLDSDMRVYADLRPLLAALEKAPIILTPHVLAPTRHDAFRQDADFVRAGSFNAGCFAVTRSDEAKAFLNWWLNAMMRERSLNDFWCRDQLWLNLAPVYFPAASILRHPGLNVAYWNLAERKLARREGVYFANGEPLLAFHFSLFDPAQPTYVANRDSIVAPVTDATVQSLLDGYVKELAAAGQAQCIGWSYKYAAFSNGVPITAFQRRYFLDHAWDASHRLGSPFDPDFVADDCRGSRSIYAYHDFLPRARRRVQRALRQNFGFRRDP